MTPRDPGQDEAFPPDLIEDLSRLYSHSAPIPADIDRAIHRTLTGRSTTIRRLRLLLRWGGGAAAAAAILLIALNLHPAVGPSKNVTILDAFSLARQLKSGAKIDKAWDANHDGVIDQKDVDLLAAQAVSLTSGGPR